MEYFRAPAFCHGTKVMTDPGGIVCLCGKSLDLHRAWQQAVPGADSQCMHCRRCYDSRAQLISARRQPGGQPVPRAPQQFQGALHGGMRSRQLWQDGRTAIRAAAAPTGRSADAAHAPIDPGQLGS